MDFRGYPGGELISQGLADLDAGMESVPALVVAIGAPRLRDLGVAVPAHAVADPEVRLYRLLGVTAGNAAHSQYNALTRRLVSFERALACGGPTTIDGLRRLMHALGQRAASSAHVYFTGGATAVLLEWRSSTIDVDLRLEPDQDAVLRAIADLKDSLDINVELAAPSDFIPELPGWRDRSCFIQREGPLDFCHYDFYAQCLSKIERGHAMDAADVKTMIDKGLVDRTRLGELFAAIEPELYRYPAIDSSEFRRRVDVVLQG